MKYKVNILEPWQSGTEASVEALIVKQSKNQFLIFIEANIKVRGENAHYFICKFKNENDESALKSSIEGVYPINMVFDKSIRNEQQEVPDINSYRANFLMGEIIISPL